MKNTTFKLAAVAVAAASALAGQAYAAGFMLTEQSVAGLGRSYAGIGVDGTDISGVYYNPATMTLHKGTILQAGFVGIGLNLDYKGKSGATENGREKSQAIPHGYLLHQINDSTWFGLAMTVPFGMGTEFGDDWEMADHGISAQILTFDFNPNVAWKASEKLSFGAGVSVQYAAADLTKKTKLYDTTAGKENGGSAFFGESSVRSEIDADSIAWGWNVGMMWSPLENLRFGLSYRSKIKHDADGDLTIDEADLDENSFAYKSGTITSDKQLEAVLGMKHSFGTLPGSAVVSAPAWAMATVAWDVNQLLSLYGTFRWTDWSSFDKLDIESQGKTVNTIQNNWRDTYLTSLGADLRITDRWTLRGGVAYETSPIATKEFRTAIIPDADRWWFSVGSSYKISEDMIADVGFAHLHGVHERSLYDEHGEVGKFRKLDAYLLGVQLQYKF